MRDMGDEIVLRSLQYVWTSYNNDDNYYTDVHDYYELPFERLTLITVRTDRYCKGGYSRWLW
jgi:hypothetical protein